MSQIRKLIAVVLLLAALALLVAGVSMAAFPQWLGIPGGLLLLIVAAFTGLADLGGKLKSWTELLFGAEKKEPPAASQPGASINISGNKMWGRGNQINVRRENNNVSDNEMIGTDQKIEVGAKPGPKPRDGRKK